MIRDIRIILSNCLTCAAEKVKYYDIPEIRPTKVQTAPFTLVAIDLIEYKSKTAKGNKFIIVCIDAHSKWVEA